MIAFTIAKEVMYICLVNPLPLVSGATSMLRKQIGRAVTGLLSPASAKAVSISK